VERAVVSSIKGHKGAFGRVPLAVRVDGRELSGVLVIAAEAPDLPPPGDDEPSAAFGEPLVIRVAQPAGRQLS
jgi:hypothetical protein